MTDRSNDELIRAFAQIGEVQTLLLNGTIPPLALRPWLQQVIEGKLPVRYRAAAQQPLLLTPQQQLHLVRSYNERFWEGYLSESQLTSIGYLVGGYPDPFEGRQRLDQFSVLHVEFDTLRRTIEMWSRVLQANSSYDQNCSTRELQRFKTVELVPGARTYAPGIHHVCLDLTARWRPEGAFGEGDSMHAVRLREQAADPGSGVIPAHGEVLSAYGLHPRLVDRIGHKGLDYVPGAHLAGYQFCGVSGGVLALAKTLRSKPLVELQFLNDSFLTPECALPTVHDTSGWGAD